MKYAKVAVDEASLAFDREFDYIIPKELEASAKKGVRVTVPFGAGNRKRLGIIFEVVGFSKEKKLKEIREVVDAEPFLNDELLSLARRIKDRTFCSLYEAARLALPAGATAHIKTVVSYAANPRAEESEVAALKGLEKEIFDYLKRRGEFVKSENIFKALGAEPDLSALESAAGRGLLLSNRDAVWKAGELKTKMVRLLPENAEIKLTRKQKAMADVLREAGEASVRELCYFTGLTPAVANALVKNGAAEFFEEETPPVPDFTKIERAAGPINLTEEQETAFEKLSSLASSGKSATALLYGVTGSGKTLVYMKVIDEILASGGSVVLLVPEIGLTPQALSIFGGRYGGDVAVFHSGLPMRERFKQWKRVKTGDARIVIGTRSAIFAPVENLRLIIIDEEQEDAYKSEKNPRYDAVDAAKFRAAYNKSLLILASATPSVESYAAAKRGKYELCVLSNRYGNAILPKTVAVDMRTAPKAPGSEGISLILYEKLKENLERGEQSILLINRRGFRTCAICSSCGAAIQCPNCSVSMTYHLANGRLMCHYCGRSVPFSEVCPKCGKKSVGYSGFGTQKIENELAGLLPDAKIIRFDSDSTTNKNKRQKLLDGFQKGEYDIMIGTQMVAKGFDFPNVTLAGVISVDQRLYDGDFRSLEKTFSLLTQVAGRSGRGELAGTAIIQTTAPENEIIRLAAAQDYDAFFNTEIRLRRALVYPPFCDLCVIGLTGEDEIIAGAAAREALELLKKYTSGEYKGEKVIALGPAPARVFKISGKYRYRLTIKCRNSERFRNMILKILIDLNADSRFSKTTAGAVFNPNSAS